MTEYKDWLDQQNQQSANQYNNKVLAAIERRQKEEARERQPNIKDVAIGGIKGVGKDAEVETLPNGAKHSRLDRAFHLLPALALSKIAEILHEGADKYEPVELMNSVRANWRGIPSHSHVNHALQHLVAFLAEDTQDDHLGHAAARLLFALELRESQERSLLNQLCSKMEDKYGETKW